MITVKTDDVISVVPIRSEDGNEGASRSIVVYTKSGQVCKKETNLTARSFESKLNKDYYIKIK